VRLVDDQGVIAAQPPVPLHLGQQDAVGHHLDPGAVAGGVGEPDLVAGHLAEPGAQLAGDPLGHRAGRDPARLGVADLAGHAAAELQADLRQLGGLARARLARDDQHLMVADGRGDLVLALADRELGRIRERECQGSVLQGSGRVGSSMTARARTAQRFCGPAASRRRAGASAGWR
jgi:hypothetical protein